MDLELVVESYSEAETQPLEPAILGCIEATLTYAGIARPCSVSLSFVEADEMRALNAEWRGVDAPTDVLSFECERPDETDVASDVPAELGDIVLCPEVVAGQAGDFGTSLLDEYRLLSVHATLHLLGYDHEDEDEAREMQTIEDAILAGMDTDGTLTDTTLAIHRTEECA